VTELEIAALRINFDIWMAEEKAKLTTSPEGYQFGWVNPRKFPGFMELIKYDRELEES
jgi:hypothetical protein